MTRKINLISKGESKQLSEHFNQDELDCKCRYIRCHFTLFSKEVLALLEKSRVVLDNKPLTVSSAFRCQKHNLKVRGVQESLHTTGLAVDIVKPKHVTFNEFIDCLLSVGWRKIIPYKDENFCHCEV